MKLYPLNQNTLKKIKNSQVNVAIYGLGKMGLPLAAVFANQGFHVIGVDINLEHIKKINKGENPIIGEGGLDNMLKKVVKVGDLKATVDGIQASKKSDIKIIIVPTFMDEDNNPDLKIVIDATEKIARGLQRGDIVILESTAPPGTTINLIARILEKVSGLQLNKDFSVGHCPERTSSKTAIVDIMGKPSPKIVSGSDEKTTQILVWLYKKINKRGVIPVTNTTVAELVKIWEGIYRDVNIAFSNNLYQICREFGVDAFEVINACNTDKYCNILTPGPGVGGHCIPVYPYFILKNIKSHKKLLTLTREINDKMSEHVISLVKDVLKEKGKVLKNTNILLLGISYRAGVKETRKSPGIKIAKELRSLETNLFIYDPLYSEKEVREHGLNYKGKHDFTEIDCVIIATREKEFEKIPWIKIAKNMRTRTIVDTSNIIDYSKLRQLDFAIRRVGYAR